MSRPFRRSTSRPPGVHPIGRRLAVVVVAVGVGSLAVPTAVAAPCWRPPVDAPVTDPYRPPTCRWCPGNRGIEYGTVAGQTVRAVDTGEVTYAGSVAGRRYVVVEHADGLRVTYGELGSIAVERGDLVIRGQRIGTTGTTFHFGVRRGDEYLDPTPLLAERHGRPRLVPSDGSPGPAVPAQWRCGTGSRSDSRGIGVGPR